MTLFTPFLAFIVHSRGPYMANQDLKVPTDHPGCVIPRSNQDPYRSNQLEPSRQIMDFFGLLWSIRIQPRFTKIQPFRVVVSSFVQFKGRLRCFSLCLPSDKLHPVGAILSSEHSHWNAGHCINGEASDFCHTKNEPLLRETNFTLDPIQKSLCLLLLISLH